MTTPIQVNRIIVYINNDGYLETITPFWRARLEGESDQAFAERVVELSLPDYVEEYDIVDRAALPQDVYFRPVWAYANGVVKVDMAKARDLHMDNIRALRAKKFIELGFPTKLNEALEEAIIPIEVREELQELRDLPETIDLSKAKTPEALKAIVPDQLKNIKQ